MKKYTLILISLALLFGLFFLFKQQKKNIIPELTQEERELFGKMWETLYYEAHFGYTLIGSKPVSIQNWSKDALKVSPQTFYFYFDGRTKKLWEQFSKKHPSDYYALNFKEFKLPKKIDPDQETYGEVIFVNKRAVKKCFLENKKLMTESCSFSDLSPETIATEVLSSHNHELVGLILGYGANSSKYFQRDDDLCAYYKNDLFFPQKLSLSQGEFDFLKDTIVHTKTNKITLDPEDVALELKERLNTPFHTLQDYLQENPLRPISLPCFRAVENHPETLALIDKYKQELEKVVQFALSKPLLDSILHIYFFGELDE